MFKQLFLLSRTNYKRDNIDDKQSNQHHFQLDSDHVFVLYHALCDTFGKCLHQDKIVICKVHYTDIVSPASRTADKGAFPPMHKNSP